MQQLPSPPAKQYLNNSAESFNDHGNNIGVASSMSFPSRYSFFDRDYLLPMYRVLEWCQESRATLISQHPTFRKWKQENGSNFVVKAQMGRFIRKVEYSPFSLQLFRVDQYFEQIGKTSFRFSYIIYENDEAVARAICALVNTEFSQTGARSASALPPYIASEIAWAEKDPEGAKYLANIPKALSVSSASGAVSVKKFATYENLSLPVYPVVVRYSDEDTNHHTNQASYVKFIEDHLHAAKVKGVMALWIEYIAETRVDDRLEVRFTAVGQEFGSAIEIVRVGKYLTEKNDKEEVVCRAWCAHDVSHLVAITASDFFLEQSAANNGSSTSKQ